MEQTSNSQSESASGVSDSTDAVYICKVCHRQLSQTADHEELAHRACLAELRCGITLDGTVDRRTRELDRV